MKYAYAISRTFYVVEITRTLNLSIYVRKLARASLIYANLKYIISNLYNAKLESINYLKISKATYNSFH